MIRFACRRLVRRPRSFLPSDSRHYQLRSCKTRRSVEMARPKVTGRNEPPRNIRAREFKEDEKKAKLARQRKYTKEARAKRKTLIDPTIPLWRHGFYTAVDSFLAAHDMDRMGEANIAAEAKANENNANQNGNTSGAIVLYQADASKKPMHLQMK
uniref:Uncharacterized protein n=1 Tax=Solanum tuberosum TaxID=4113 RepID=M1DK67_SOLTU